MKESGVPLQSPPSLLFVEVSQTGLGVLLVGLTALEEWAKGEVDLHVNILETQADLLDLSAFQDWPLNRIDDRQCSKQGGTISHLLSDGAIGLRIGGTLCSEITTRYILGKKNM